MNTKALATAIALPFAAGLALAQELPAVQVTSSENAENSIAISCSDPNPPEVSVVMDMLGSSDPGRGPELRKKLMNAAAEACRAGESRILVQRTQSGVSWTPLDSPPAATNE